MKHARPTVLACAWLLALAAAPPPAWPAAFAEGPPPSEASSPRRGISYPGASFLFQMAEVTVVYPAGPGEPVELNAWSAQQRARYLQEQYGVRAHVRSDDAVSPEELRGNLLLLGWNNRLLGTEQAPLFFERNAQGFRFFGAWETDPRTDLIFMHRSPYNPDAFLVFWSRIDPERDRLLVLPYVGSDWAILRDFLVVRQGMFLPGQEWPPKRDAESEHDISAQIIALRSLRRTHASEHFLVDYDPSSVKPEELREIVLRREAALAEAAEFLGAPLPDWRVHLYLYPDVETKKQHTGVPDPVHSLPSRREIHMLERYARSPSPHEEIHVLAHYTYGPCALTALYEGLALAAEGKVGGVDLELRAAVLVDEGRFPSLDDLLDEETGRKLPADVRATAAGIFVRWLRDWAGTSSFRRAYRLWEGTPAALARRLDKPAEALRRDFGEHLQALVQARQRDLRALDHERRAQQALLAGDYAGVARALEKVVELKPDDPQALFNLASALMRTAEYARAERLLKRILELPLDDSQSYFVIFTHYQLGRLYDIQGRRDEAMAQYRKVLQLPDQHDAHRLAREAMARPVTADQLQ